jgi:succinoglycan biosynthesis transport protein ExoP
VDLRRLLVIVRARLLIVVGCLALGAAVAFLVSINLTKVYEAQATLLVGGTGSGTNPDLNQLLVSQRLSQTYASLATTRPNLEAVAKQLGLTTDLEGLAKTIRADAALDSTLLTITAQSSDPDAAAAIANALAKQLVAVSPEIQGRQPELQASIAAALQSTQEQLDTTQAEIDRLSANINRTAEQDAQLAAMDARLVTLRSTFASLVASSSGYQTTQLALVDPAVPPKAPISPRVLLNTLIGALLGLLAGVGLVLVKARLDDTVKTPEDAEATVGLPAIGVISKMPGSRRRNEVYRLVALLYPRSPVTETYRTLRANIEFATSDSPISTLLVTSASPGEGKTITSANLGVVFAQGGRRVLLVDADLRRPGLHRLFGIPNTHGLTTLLRAEDVDVTRYARATEQANLWVLPTGPLPADPADLVRSHRMEAAITRLAAAYDLVILDSPPVQSVADAAVLSSHADATLLVVGAGAARRRTLQLARESLDRAGARVIGVVLNLLRDPAAVAYGGHYTSYPTDETAHDESLPGGTEPKQSPGARAT